ncbi:hypothetical protein D3C85_1396520 [compost metagenome]
MFASATISATMKIATNNTLRISGIIVCARALARPLRDRVSARCTAVSLRIQISQAKISVPARLSSLTLTSWPSPSVNVISDMPQTRRPSSMKANHTSRWTRV